VPPTVATLDDAGVLQTPLDHGSEARLQTSLDDGSKARLREVHESW
jgi:hypothetical protein